MKKDFRGISLDYENGLMDMKELMVFEGTSIRMQEQEVYATRKQLMELYDVPRKTLSDNINKLKKDGLITGRNVAMSSSMASRDYDTEVYELDEILAIGLRLRSDKAIKIQRWAINLMRKEIESSQQKMRMQQAQLDYFWDKEDQNDLYK